MKLKRNHNGVQRYAAALWPVLLSCSLSGCVAGSNLQGSGAKAVQAPQITQQPADQTLFIGDMASFTVTATGTVKLGLRMAAERCIAECGQRGDVYDRCPDGDR